MKARMRIAYFDCFCGAGGDMIVASLIDAGADAVTLSEGLATLGLSGHALSIDKVSKQGFAATRFHVALDDGEKQPHRHLKHVTEILHKAKLPDRVRARSIRIFTRLAEAEARVHGTTVDKVHFHEVGAVDAILDVVGAMWALELLNVERVVCSPIPVGSGTVTCSHGVMPVPAPATAELLRGVPIATCDESGELTTPTAAAVLTTLAEDYGSPPAMTIESTGYGAGSREGQKRPNLLRVLIGEMVTRDDAEADCVWLLETNLDDATPQIVAYCLDRLLSAGALDAWSVPIHMKKQRSGMTLCVLCRMSDRAAMERIIFAETPTLGIRRSTVERTILPRRHEIVETPFGPIRVKVGARGGIENATPEFEDCSAAAVEHRVALREVVAAAEFAWRRNQRR